MIIDSCFILIYFLLIIYKMNDSRSQSKAPPKVAKSRKRGRKSTVPVRAASPNEMDYSCPTNKVESFEPEKPENMKPNIEVKRDFRTPRRDQPAIWRIRRVYEPLLKRPNPSPITKDQMRNLLKQIDTVPPYSIREDVLEPSHDGDEFMSPQYGVIKLPKLYQDAESEENKRTYLNEAYRDEIVRSVFSSCRCWIIYSTLLFKEMYQRHIVGAPPFNTLAWTLAHAAAILHSAIAMEEEIHAEMLLAAIYISDQIADSDTSLHNVLSYLMFCPDRDEQLWFYGESFVRRFYSRRASSPFKVLSGPVEGMLSDISNSWDTSEEEYAPSQEVVDDDRVFDRCVDDKHEPNCQFRPDSDKELLRGFHSIRSRLAFQQKRILNRLNYRIPYAFEEIYRFKMHIEQSSYYHQLDGWILRQAASIRRFEELQDA